MSKLREIKVLPIAFESLGVRSMCTYIETPDVRILLDAGVSLGPLRFGFSPHPREYEAIKDRRETIIRFAEKADIITVSHYHFDHHTPSYTDWAYNWCSAEIAERIYQKKIVLVKNYRDHINFSQRRRGWIFEKTSGKHAKRFEVADGKTFTFGSTTISFSRPVFHGPEGSDLGWVIMVAIKYENECVFFAPDVQGPISQKTLKMIIDEKPQLAIIGGPPTYLVGFRIDHKAVDLAIKNLKVIARHIPVVIVDHHILRDENWKKIVQPIVDTAVSAGHKIFTAAEFLGRQNLLLESQRKRLYENEPPSSEFVKWSRISSIKRKLIPPPI